LEFLGMYGGFAVVLAGNNVSAVAILFSRDIKRKLTLLRPHWLCPYP
jgi:hypothetical protein